MLHLNDLIILIRDSSYNFYGKKTSSYLKQIKSIWIINKFQINK